MHWGTWWKSSSCMKTSWAWYQHSKMLCQHMQRTWVSWTILSYWYMTICTLIPTVELIYAPWCKQLTSAANAAHQEDTATLKHAIIEYMILDPKVDTHHLLITKSQLKSMRGFSHTNTASTLCPVKWMVEYLKDDVWVPFPYISMF